MSQDYNPVLGTTLVSDLDDVVTDSLDALRSLHSGLTEPATMVAYMPWADTTTGLLKIRNAPNSAWVTIGTLSATNLGLLSLAGGTMTGNIAFGGTQKCTGLAAGSGAGDSVRYEQAILASGVNAHSADQSFGGFKATNLATPTADGDAATKGYVDALTGVAGAFEGRLQRDSATQASIQRFAGNTIMVNGSAVSIGASGILLLTSDNRIDGTGADAGVAMGVSTLHYIYISNSTASPFPSDLRASLTAPSLFNGVYYLGTSGNAANWRFVGWARTNGSTEFVDTETQRFVVNYYNRRALSLRSVPGYNDDNAATQWTSASTTWAEANAGTGSKIEFIANGEDAVQYQATAVSVAGGATQTHAMGVGEDSTTTPACASVQSIGAINEEATCNVAKSYIPPTPGYYYLDLLVKTSNGTGSWYADLARNGAAADPPATMIIATVMG